MDNIPPPILTLQREMHESWLAQWTHEHVTWEPKLAMDKYFLDALSHLPSQVKTTGPVGFLFDRRRTVFGPFSASAARLRAEAAKVAGLHAVSVHDGVNSEIVFLGWQRAVVEAAAEAHGRQVERVEGVEGGAEGEEEVATAQRGNFVWGGGVDGAESPPYGKYTLDVGGVEGEWVDWWVVSG